MQFNTAGSIARRFWSPRTHLRSARRMGIYLAGNLTSRREIRRKQGRRLGDDRQQPGTQSVA
jgi:hypothetical protein